MFPLILSFINSLCVFLRTRHSPGRLSAERRRHINNSNGKEETREIQTYTYVRTFVCWLLIEIYRSVISSGCIDFGLLKYSWDCWLNSSTIHCFTFHAFREEEPSKGIILTKTLMGQCQIEWMSFNFFLCYQCNKETY